MPLCTIFLCVHSSHGRLMSAELYNTTRGDLVFAPDTNNQTNQPEKQTNKTMPINSQAIFLSFPFCIPPQNLLLPLLTPWFKKKYESFFNVFGIGRKTLQHKQSILWNGNMSYHHYGLWSYYYYGYWVIPCLQTYLLTDFCPQYSFRMSCLHLLETHNSIV